MTTRVLDVDLLPAMDEMMAALREAEPDLARQMQILELAVARYCWGVGSHEDAIFVADSFHKHVKQMINQRLEYLDGKAPRF